MMQSNYVYKCIYIYIYIPKKIQLPICRNICIYIYIYTYTIIEGNMPRSYKLHFQQCPSPVWNTSTSSKTCSTLGCASIMYAAFFGLFSTEKTCSTWTSTSDVHAWAMEPLEKKICAVDIKNNYLSIYIYMYIYMAIQPPL
jgi:hypothetical protein